MTLWWKHKTQFSGFFSQKKVRDLHENACAISCTRISAYSPPMFKVTEQSQSFFDDIVRFLVFDVYYESDTAAVMLVLWIVKALGQGIAKVVHLCPCSEDKFSIQFTSGDVLKLGVFWPNCVSERIVLDFYSRGIAIRKFRRDPFNSWGDVIGLSSR